MSVNIKEKSFLPVYRQLADHMYSEIIGGNWAKGQKLPTEPELSERFHTTRTTLRKALRLLVERGLIRQTKGQGTFVSDKLALAGGKRRVGIITGRRIENVMRDIYYSIVVAGIDRAFSDVYDDYEMLFLHRDQNSDIFTQAKKERIDAVIDITSNIESYFNERIIELPHVLVSCDYRHAKATGCVSVGVDYQGSYRRQLEGLISLGHRDIATVARNQYDADFIQKVFRENRIAAPPTRVVPDEHLETEGIKPSLDPVFAVKRPTACFFCSYLLANAGYEYIKACGLKVPEEVSVAGVGNYRRFFGDADPEFMTTNEPIQELGETAGRLLLTQLAGKAPAQRELILECQLLPKPTVAPVDTEMAGRQDKLCKAVKPQTGIRIGDPMSVPASS